jgi:hypothetical protein
LSTAATITARATSDGEALRDAAWLRASIAAVWIVTALTVLHPYYREVGGAYLARFGLPWWIMIATDVAELILGAWVLLRPSSSLIAGLQIAMVASFTVLLAAIEPMLLASPFGVLSKNLPFCVVIAVAFLLESEGWTPRAERLLAFGMAAVWITEGLVPKILFQQEIELAMAPAVGLRFAPPWLLVGAVGALQLASGIAVLLLRGPARRWLLHAQAIALAFLPIVVGFLSPELWVHPFGPFSKNVPILVGTLILARRCSR